MSKIRILHSLIRVGSGGVEQRRLSLARYLPANKYEQAIVCSEAVGGLPKKFDEVKCKIYEVGEFKWILDRRPYINAISIIKKFQPHIIHGAVFEGVALAAVAGRLGRVPIIIGEETSDPATRRWSGHLLYRLLSGMTHHMVAVSPAVKDYLVNGIKLPSNKVTLINNGVLESLPATTKQKDEVRAELGIKNSDFIIGSCGRIEDRSKRFSDLIRALVLVRRDCVNAKLLIVGNGPDEAMLRALAAQLGVAEQVIFAGYRVDTRPYFEVMDIFALASAHEAFGLVLVEAMYACLPVVATHVGGIPGVVLNEETGYLVPPSDPAALASSLLVLINNESLRHEMGGRGLFRARNKFSSERYVNEVNNLYELLLKDGLI